MKSTLLKTLCALSLAVLTTTLANAQGTAFTYQGRLNNNGSPASGNFDFQFILFADAGGTQPVGSVFSTNNIPVSAGLFTTTVNFGAGIFTGSNYFIQISVRTNIGGTGSFTSLTPLQPVTAVPYAIMANTASNLLGTLPTGQLSGTLNNTQLANSSVTVAAGTGLSGGGTVPLGGATSLNNTGVLSVTGNSDITANTSSGAVTLGDTGTSIATPNTLVKRDASGGVAVSNLTVLGPVILPSALHVFATNGPAFTQVVESFDQQENIFLGLAAGNSIGSGGFNTGLGGGALFSTTSGSRNTGVGNGALFLNAAGASNTAVGFDALLSVANGTNNIAIGTSAGTSLSTGSSNIYIGSDSGGTAENNTIRIGTPGVHTNTVIAGLISGNGGGLTNLNGSQFANAAHSNFFVGLDSGNLTTTGSKNVGVGQGTLSNNTTGTGNAALGYVSLGSNTTGSFNTGLGFQALAANNGGGNTAVGASALQANTSGFANTAVGDDSMLANTAGGNNVAIGGSALSANQLGSANTAVGSGALDISLGSNNVALGSQALAEHQTADGQNTAIGTSALQNLASGSNNIALGNLAGGNLGAGVSNIDIGNAGISGDNNIIRIGTSQTQAFIAGSITGNGGGLTNLNAANLSGSVALLNATQTFTAGNTISPAAGIEALNVKGSTTGGFGSPVMQVQNQSTATTAGSALRVVNSTTTAPSGALSVSTGSSGSEANSILAQFGNSSAFVLVITNDGSVFSASNLVAKGNVIANGSVTAAGFSGNGSGLTSTVTAANYLNATDSTFQAIATVNTAQNITFAVNQQISGWAHTVASASFTCNQTGLYLVQFNLVATVHTGGVNQSFQTQAAVNGSAIPGSGSAYIVQSTTAVQVSPISQSFISPFNSGDVLNFQMFSTTTSASIGTGSGAQPTASVTIVRIQ